MFVLSLVMSRFKTAPFSTMLRGCPKSLIASKHVCATPLGEKQYVRSLNRNTHRNRAGDDVVT